MQAASDIMLGWIRVDGLDDVTRDFYIRQLWDAKGSALVDVMEPSAMMVYAETCGWTLARGHARSGDAVAIASYLGGGQRSIARWPTSRTPTPTRTSATTRRSPPPPRRAASGRDGALSAP